MDDPAKPIEMTPEIEAKWREMIRPIALEMARRKLGMVEIIHVPEAPGFEIKLKFYRRRP